MKKTDAAHPPRRISFMMNPTRRGDRKERALMSVFLLTALLVLTPQAAQQTVKGSIEGIVTRAGTSEPLADVQVGLVAGTSTLNPGASVVTDTTGRFTFKDVSPGQY